MRTSLCTKGCSTDLHVSKELCNVSQVKVYHHKKFNSFRFPTQVKIGNTCFYSNFKILFYHYIVLKTIQYNVLETISNFKSISDLQNTIEPDNP